VWLWVACFFETRADKGLRKRPSRRVRFPSRVAEGPRIKLMPRSSRFGEGRSSRPQWSSRFWNNSRRSSGEDLFLTPRAAPPQAAFPAVSPVTTHGPGDCNSLARISPAQRHKCARRHRRGPLRGAFRSLGRQIPPGLRIASPAAPRAFREVSSLRGSALRVFPASLPQSELPQEGRADRAPLMQEPRATRWYATVALPTSWRRDRDFVASMSALSAPGIGRLAGSSELFEAKESTPAHVGRSSAEIR
jgi:hypothetical protein